MIYLISISTALNFILLGLLIYQLKFTKKIKDRPQSVELKEFIQDLLMGDGLVKISRVDSANVVLRSPRR